MYIHGHELQNTTAQCYYCNLHRYVLLVAQSEAAPKKRSKFAVGKQQASHIQSPAMRRGAAGDTASYQDWMCPLVKNVLAAAEISCRRHQFADVVHRTWVDLFSCSTNKTGRLYIYPRPAATQYWLVITNVVPKLRISLFQNRSIRPHKALL